MHQIQAPFRVTVGHFIVSEATMPNALADLLDKDLEQAEEESLLAFIAEETAPVWGTLQLPTARTLASPFGEYRRFNGDTPHAPHRLGFPRHPGDAGRFHGRRAGRFQSAG